MTIIEKKSNLKIEQSNFGIVEIHCDICDAIIYSNSIEFQLADNNSDNSLNICRTHARKLLIKKLIE